MKIVHLIMTGGYSEGWSYQDSVLVECHAKDNDVYVITTEYERQVDSMVKVNRYHYKTNAGVTVYRLKHAADFLQSKITKVFRVYRGIYKILNEIKPDIIFSHNCQYFGTSEIAKYMKKNPSCRLYVDNHADFSNINNNWISKNILHKLIWRYCAKKLEPFVTKFYGVLPARVDFLVNMYGIDKKKVEYLPLGVEDNKAEEARKPGKIAELRKRFNIERNDFLIVTGGKIDRFKMQTLYLMQAVKSLSIPNVKLLVYGSVLPEIKEEFDNLVDNDIVQYAGWISSDETYNYIASSQLVVYPGRHSVLWEQTVGQGVPMVCKYWEGTTHVDLGGNVKFLHKDSCDEIMKLLRKIICNKKIYLQMKLIAEKNGRNYFSYEQIAKKSISLV